MKGLKRDLYFGNLDKIRESPLKYSFDMEKVIVIARHDWSSLRVTLTRESSPTMMRWGRGIQGFGQFVVNDNDRGRAPMRVPEWQPMGNRQALENMRELQEMRVAGIVRDEPVPDVARQRYRRIGVQEMQEQFEHQQAIMRQMYQREEEDTRGFLQRVRDWWNE